MVVAVFHLALLHIACEAHIVVRCQQQAVLSRSALRRGRSNDEEAGISAHTKGPAG
jgi:hypothetical protein